jgi:hypothetical protein
VKKSVPSQLDSNPIPAPGKQSFPAQLDSNQIIPSSVKKPVSAQLDSNQIIPSSTKQSVPSQLDSNPIPASVKQSVPAQLDSNPTIKAIPVVSTKSNPQTSKPEVLSERQSNNPQIQSTTTKINKLSATTNSHTHSSAANKDPVTTITKTRREITSRKTVPGPRHETKSSDENNCKTIMTRNVPLNVAKNVDKEKQGNEKEVKRVEGLDKNEKKGESGMVGNIERRKLTNPVTPEFVRREQRKKLLKQQQANKQSPNKTNTTDKSRLKSTLHM